MDKESSIRMIKSKSIIASSKELDMLYKTNAIVLIGINFREIDIRVSSDIFSLMHYCGIKFNKDEIKIFITTGKEINRKYKLSKNNQYKDNLPFSLISFEDLDISIDKDKLDRMDEHLNKIDIARLNWRDVVNYNMAEEFFNGKRKSIPRDMHWLIEYCCNYR